MDGNSIYYYEYSTRSSKHLFAVYFHLGFAHEHNRPDRDNFIRVNFTNISPGKKASLSQGISCKTTVKQFSILILPSGDQIYFVKSNNTIVDTLNTSYDYASVMHYNNVAFSSNGQPTIEAIQNVSFGHSNISATDILATRIYYNCSASGSPLQSIPSPTLR